MFAAMREALLMSLVAVKKVSQPGHWFDEQIATFVLTPSPEHAYGELFGSPWCALSRPEAMIGPPCMPSDVSCRPRPPLALKVQPIPSDGNPVPVRLTHRPPLFADATMAGTAFIPPDNKTPAM